MTEQSCERIYLKGFNETVLPGFLNTFCTETALNLLKEKNTGKAPGQSGGCFFLLVDCTNKLGDTVQFMKDLLELVKADETFALPCFAVSSGVNDPEELEPELQACLKEMIFLRDEAVKAVASRYLPANLAAALFLEKRCKFNNDPVRVRS